jgi:quercetin dioxygenase-like cupin family protein
MTAKAPPRRSGRGRPLLLLGGAFAAALALLAAYLALPDRLFAPAGSAAGPSGGKSAMLERPATAAPKRPSASVTGPGVSATVLLQQPLERLPDDPPYVLRATELEMEPSARIFEHRQLGVGAHVVVRGSIAIENLDAGQTAIYRAGEAYFEGLGPLHRAENPGAETNRVLMFDLLSAGRGFDGAQQFTARGRHNEGELRSGPYAQVPLDELPAEPLMLRVTSLAFGPKAKTAEHTRLGPALFFVQDGTATVRRDRANSSMTYGTNGYFFENGREPFILENKPAAPARFLAVEVLSASLGDAPSTVHAGAEAAR